MPIFPPARGLDGPHSTGHVIRIEAGRLFAENTYDGTTIKQVAEAAGLTVEQVRDQFPTKEALLFCEFSEILLTLTESLRNRPSDEGSDRAAMSAVLQVLRTHFEENLGPSDGGVILRAAVGRILDRLEAPLGTLLTARLRDGHAEMSGRRAASIAASDARLAVSACKRI